MTVAEKNLLIKKNVTNETVFPEGTVRIGDFSFAVPTVVDGEERWGVWTLVAKNNKATKTTPAFDPEVAAEEWRADCEIKAAEIKAAKEIRAARLARSAHSSKR